MISPTNVTGRGGQICLAMGAVAPIGPGRTPKNPKYNNPKQKLLLLNKKKTNSLPLLCTNPFSKRMGEREREAWEG